MSPTQTPKPKRTPAQVAQDELAAVRDQIRRMEARKAKAEDAVADAVRRLERLRRLEASRALHPDLPAPQEAETAPWTQPVRDSPQA